MILIADSGSTKTEWKTINDGIPGESKFSGGINPYFLASDEIFRLLENDCSISMWPIPIAGILVRVISIFGRSSGLWIKSAIMVSSPGNFYRSLIPRQRLSK